MLAMMMMLLFIIICNKSEKQTSHDNEDFIVAGSFLTDYTNKSNLHIAVTDSRGEVVEFDQHGLHRQHMEIESAPEIHIFADIFWS